MSVADRLIKIVEWVLVIMFGIMAILVFGNVVLRYLFNSGIVFSEEVSRFLFMWITLIGALVVMREHGHLGMNSIVRLWGETGQRISRFLADSLMLGACILLVDGTYAQIIIGMDDLAPVTGIPMGIIQLSMLISSVGMVVLLAYSLWRQITGRMPKEELTGHHSESNE